MMKLTTKALVFSAVLASLAAPALSETLTWATRHSYVDWDPGATYSEETYVLGNVYETLTRFEDGAVRPLLASSWEKQQDGKVWVVQLRDDVTFQDGTPMTAAAVKASIEYIKTEGRGAAFIWDALESIEVTGEHALTFSFSGPTAFDLIASAQYGAYIIAPAAVERGHDWMQAGNGIGTGPYKLVQIDPGERVLLEKYENYWGGWADGSFDRVIIEIVSEASTRIQMLKSGAADIADVPPDQIASLQQTDGVSITQGDSWQNSMFLFNVDKYPTDNLKFREALTYLWDYDSVLNDVMAGTATKPLGPLPTSMWGSGKYDMPVFDPERAMQLLEESGVPQSDWTVSVLYIVDEPVYANSIELFQAMAAEVGVTVELRPGEWSVIWEQAKNPETSANMTSMTWWPAYATPSDWLWTQWHSEEDALFNLSFYKNPAYDKAAEEFFDLQGIDIEQAAAKSIEAQDILMADVPAIFYADTQRVYAHSSDIKGMDRQFNPAYETLYIHSLGK